MEKLDRPLSAIHSGGSSQELLEELERGIAQSRENSQKAAYHLRLGRILESQFLSPGKALKHYQDAYKLNPAAIESLALARDVYWGLGQRNMIHKLLELELRVGETPATDLLLELGDVLTDEGDYEKAEQTYRRSLAASGGSSITAQDALRDLAVAAKEADEYIERCC